jgi:hypothetical protein
MVLIGEGSVREVQMDVVEAAGDAKVNVESVTLNGTVPVPLDEGAGATWLVEIGVVVSTVGSTLIVIVGRGPAAEIVTFDCEIEEE